MHSNRHPRSFKMLSGAAACSLLPISDFSLKRKDRRNQCHLKLYYTYARHLRTKRYSITQPVTSKINIFFHINIKRGIKSVLSQNKMRSIKCFSNTKRKHNTVQQRSVFQAVLVTNFFKITPTERKINKTYQMTLVRI